MIVPIHVAIAGWTTFAAAGGRHLQRMRLQDPIADVDDVNILFHNDVAGKDAIVHPVSEAQLDG
jgi:copper(I)-binding protein